MRKLLTVLLVAFATILSAQNINLRDDYGLKVFDNKALSATHSLAQAKAAFPNYFTWIKFHGATDAQAMTVNIVAVAWNEAVWSTDGYAAPNPQSAYPQNGCQSRANIDASGIYYFEAQTPLTLAFGQYEGGGTGNATETGTNHGGPGTTGGTQIKLDHAGWLKTVFPKRNLMQSASYGDESLNGYSESFTLRGFRLDGDWHDKPHDPSFESSGVAIWDSGETSRVEYMFINGFNDSGVHNVRGTPSIFTGVSTFSNKRFGYWLDGSSLATITIAYPSGDDNGPGGGAPGWLIGGTAGYGRPGGGTLVIIGAKSETNNVEGRYNGNQGLFNLTGAWNVVVTGAWVYAREHQPTCMVVDFETYNGGLDVRGLSTEGYNNLLKITSRGTTTNYPGVGNVTPVSFVANESGVVWSSRNMGGGTVPNPCQWNTGTWSAWSACVGGEETRTRSVTSTGDCSGITPPASVETRSCGITPPTGDIPPRNTWKVTASNSSSVGNMIDGNVNTRWSSEAKQNGSEWIQVDLKVPATVKSVTLDAGASYYDCPAAYTVQLSADGTTWRTVATGKGNPNSRSPIVASFAAQSARYIKVLQTGTTAKNWWSVVELNLQ